MHTMHTMGRMSTSGVDSKAAFDQAEQGCTSHATHRVRFDAAALLLVRWSKQAWSGGDEIPVASNELLSDYELAVT